jgi:hypothetical protein
VGHAGGQLEPLRGFCGGGGAAVEQDARWVDAGTGGLTPPVRVATAFGVADRRISRVLRHTELDDALAVLGLSADDEVTAARG